jgi:hypothetical protein
MDQEEAMNQVEGLLRNFFSFQLLPPELQEATERFASVASWIVQYLPRSPERTLALRKLLEAKDHVIKANLYKE